MEKDAQALVGRIRVLIVDDTPEDRYFLRRALQSDPDHQYAIFETSSAQEGLRQCLESPPSCVLLDYQIPDLDGLDFLDALQQDARNPIPLIMLTGQGNEVVATEAMKRGATDYLVKGSLTPERLHEAISKAIEKASLVRKHAQKQAELERLAVTDELTGLRNRRYALRRLHEEIDRSMRYDSCLSLMIVDIDHFKHINDRLGHLAGDGVLKSVGNSLKASLRITDLVARYGGEEFLILLPETRLTAAYELAERLRELIRETDLMVLNGTTVHVTCSFGITELGTRDNNTDDLIARADTALYKAKQSGRDRVCYLSPDGEPRLVMRV